MLNETAQLFEFPDADSRRPMPFLEARVDQAVVAELLMKACPLPNIAAKRLMVRFGSLTRLFGASACDLERVEGMTREGAIVLKACQLLHERTLHEQVAKRTVISSWSALLAYARIAMAGEPTEQFRLFFLDKKNALIADEVTNRGTVDHAPVYPREVVKRALELDASAVILAHNHPSGDPTPSGADIDMTRQVIEACRPLKIAVHDHIVVGAEGVASFKALGLI